MADLLVGNTLASNDGQLNNQYAYYVPKIALESGEVTEVRLDLSSSTLSFKVAVYNSAGTRLWYSSEGTTGAGDDKQVVVTPTFNVTKGETYNLYIATQNLSLKRSETTVDYNAKYALTLDYTDTPPSDLFSGQTWNDSSFYDFALRVNGDIISEDVNSLFFGGGF